MILMKKMSLLWIILDLIFLVVFNAVFFILGGFEHPASVWISYWFIHFAYAMVLLSTVLTRRGKSSAVFGMSILSISITYFFVALVAGAVFILISPESAKAAVIVQLCITGFYGFFLVSNLIANERTGDAEEKRQYELQYVRTASARLKVLMDNINDKEAKSKVEKVYAAICSSPVKSHPELAQIEIRILHSINELEVEAATGDNGKIILIANSLLSAVNERNIRSKSLN